MRERIQTSTAAAVQTCTSRWETFTWHSGLRVNKLSVRMICLKAHVTKWRLRGQIWPLLVWCDLSADVLNIVELPCLLSFILIEIYRIRCLKFLIIFFERPITSRASALVHLWRVAAHHGILQVMLVCRQAGHWQVFVALGLLTGSGGLFVVWQQPN